MRFAATVSPIVKVPLVLVHVPAVSENDSASIAESPPANVPAAQAMSPDTVRVWPASWVSVPLYPDEVSEAHTAAVSMLTSMALSKTTSSDEVGTEAGNQLAATLQSIGLDPTAIWFE